MALSASQLQTLKVDIAADPTLSLLAHTSDNAQTIADAYNALDATFTVWRTDLTSDDINNAVDWTEVVAMTTNNLLGFQLLKDQTKINASLASIRQAFSSVFSSKANSIAGLLAASKRLARRIEKLFAIGTGTNASPATMTFEGSITYQDVQAAWNS